MLFSHPLVRLYCFVLISLPLFHWAHRFRFTLVDYRPEEHSYAHCGLVLRGGHCGHSRGGWNHSVAIKCYCAEFFAGRRERAHFKAFDKLMKRRGGPPPRTGDEMPGPGRRERRNEPNNSTGARNAFPSPLP